MAIELMRIASRLYAADGAGGPTPDPAPPTPQPDPAPPAGRTMTDAQVDALVKQRLDAALADERAQQSAAQATAQGKFKELAEQREQELKKQKDALDALQAQATAYEQTLQAQLDERLKALPKELQALVSGESLTIRMDALVKAEAAAKALALMPKTPGTPAGPANGGTGSAIPVATDDLAMKRRAGGYGPI